MKFWIMFEKKFIFREDINLDYGYNKKPLYEYEKNKIVLKVIITIHNYKTYLWLKIAK